MKPGDETWGPQVKTNNKTVKFSMEKQGDKLSFKVTNPIPEVVFKDTKGSGSITINQP